MIDYSKFRLQITGLACALLMMAPIVTASPLKPKNAQPARDSLGYDLSQTTQTTLRERVKTVKPMQFRRRGSGEALSPPRGWEASIFAADLGDIAAICTPDQAGGKISGTLYALDKKKGRLYALTDREADGKLDMRRTLVDKLSQVQDMACAPGGVYIATASAILYFDSKARKTTTIAPLHNLKALPAPRRLQLVSNRSGDDQKLYFTFSDTPDRFKLVRIDIATGAAENITSGEGEITALAQSGHSALWAAFGSSSFNHHAAFIAPLSAHGFEPKAGVKLAPGSAVKALMLPGTHGLADFKPWQQDIVLVQSSKQRISAFGGGINIATIPTSFGQVQPRLHIFADGFIGKHGRSAWGDPSSIVIDSRGVFIADRRSGNIWRIFPKTMPEMKIKIYPAEDLDMREPTLAAHDEAADNTDKNAASKKEDDAGKSAPKKNKFIIKGGN